MPYLQFFFIIKMFAAVDKRISYYKLLLDKKEHQSLYNCFKRAGMDTTKLKQPQITFKMVEEVIAEYRAFYPDSLWI